jgi:hypothetical protein
VPDVQCPVLPLVSEDPPSLLTRVGGALSCLVLGVVTGVVGTFAHQSGWTLFGVRLPLGLIAALIAASFLVAGLRLALDSRLEAGLAALGLVSAIALLALPGPSGSILLPANPAGFAWTIGPTVLFALILGWPRTLLRRTDSGAPTAKWNTGGGEDSSQ